MYRLVLGANYFNSCLSFLQAEKSLRIRALVNDGFNMDGIKAIFAEAEEKKCIALKSEVEEFVENLEGLKLDAEVDEDSKGIVFYYAGYIARSLLRTQTCEDCVQMIASDTKSFSADVEEEAYSADVTRGGLAKPSNLLSITACHAWELWCFIRDHEDLKKFFWKTINQRSVFVQGFQKVIEEMDSSSITNAKCKKGHPFRRLIGRIGGSLFNCAAVNRVKEMNDKIHAEKKRKVKKVDSTAERKIIKLTSGTSVAKSTTSSVDCGTCKFCKDKKKFGGPGTLKKKCVQK